MIHVVGAGVAGLAAAVALARAGRPVTLYEAALDAGGRARALPDGTDNGTHALLGANRAALRFLESIGAREGWMEPEPDGLPVLDLVSKSTQRVSLSPAGWLRPTRRPSGLTGGGLLALVRLALPGPDRVVSAVLCGHPALLRGFVEPLVVAALNTPANEASTRRLAPVLRRVAAPGAARLLVARRGLGPDLVQPALHALRAAGGRLAIGARLRDILTSNGRATTLCFGGAAVPLALDDTVVLATPPWESARLLPDLNVPGTYAPILNLHFAPPWRTGTDVPVRFLGFLGGLCQWALVRPTGISITVSAADAEARENATTLVPRAWKEVRAAAVAFSLSGCWPALAPHCRAVKERRATPRHVPGLLPRPSFRPLGNVFLAGDWTDPVLPATLDAAVRSGEAAAHRALRG